MRTRADAIDDVDSIEPAEAEATRPLARPTGADQDIVSGGSTGTTAESGSIADTQLWHVDLDNLHWLEPIPGVRIDGTEGDDVITGGLGNDDLRGWEGDDVIYGDGGNDFIYGSSGNDELYGGDGDDEIWGGTGNDVVHGGNGNDFLYVSTGAYHPTDSGVAFGGAGNDIIHGSYGIDHLYGDAGDDQIRGYDGIDYISGGDGNDALEGGYGYDMLWGGAGNDIIYGESAFNGPVSTAGEADYMYGEDGNDQIYGGGGGDSLDGGAGDDFAHGGAGNDSVSGGDGNDVLQGGDGDDSITGGDGADRLTGGVGRDTFVLTHADGIGYSTDVITDFMRNPPVNGGDIVDMRFLFNNYTDFSGTAEQAAQQGYLRFVQIGSAGQSGYGTMIYIDPNGSAPDTHPYYHDLPVAFLEGVGAGELGTPGPNYGGLSNHFLV